MCVGRGAVRRPGVSGFFDDQGYDREELSETERRLADESVATLPQAHVASLVGLGPVPGPLFEVRILRQDPRMPPRKRLQSRQISFNDLASLREDTRDRNCVGQAGNWLLALQVGQRKRCLAVAAVGGAQQSKKGLVLADGHQRSIACMPTRCRYKTECEKLNLANVRVHDVSEFLFAQTNACRHSLPGGRVDMGGMKPEDHHVTHSTDWVLPAKPFSPLHETACQ